MTTIIDIDMHDNFVYCQFEDNVKINYPLVEKMFEGTDRLEDILFAKEMGADAETCLNEMGFRVVLNDTQKEWSIYKD